MSVNLRRDDDIVIYEIDDVANTYEVEMARKGFERQNQTLGLIRDGNDIFTCSYPAQTMYEISQNDNNYMISISEDRMKIRTLEKLDDFMVEYIVTSNYKCML